MKIIALIFTVVFIHSAFGQGKIEWSANFDTSLNLIELTAEIEEGWHIYGQFNDPEDGPIPTTITFENISETDKIGEVEEIGIKNVYDENFGASLDILEGRVFFLQKLSDVQVDTIDCVVTYMICNESTCYPPVDKLISIPLN